MRKKLVLWIALVVFAVIAIFSAYKLITILGEYREGEEVYAGLNQYARIEPTVSQSGEKQPEEEDGYYIDHAGLLEINGDYIGWIHIEGTRISYPITRTNNNEYYLYRMFDGTYNGAGCVYMDCRNSPTWTDTHTVVYGHNMRTGTMFADAVNYTSQEFYDAHPTGILMTPGGNYELQFFSAYQAGVEEDAWNTDFSTQSEYASWLENAVERSAIESRFVPTPQDRVVTLSTCTFDHRTGARLVILAILKPME